MKHTLRVTLVLVIMFLAAQFIGLAVTNEYISQKEVTETGEINVTWKNLPSIAGVEIERPQVEPSTSIWLIATAVVIGTALLFLIIKFKGDFLWKAWFFLAVLICLTISFGSFMSNLLAGAAAIVLAYLKIMLILESLIDHVYIYDIF